MIPAYSGKRMKRTVPMKTKRLPHILRRFALAEGGATAIEYAIIASGISIAIVAAVIATGGSVQNLWTTVKNAFS